LGNFHHRPAENQAMKSRFSTDPQDHLDGFSFLDTGWAEAFAAFSPLAHFATGGSSGFGPVAIPATALTSEAVEALAANAVGGTPTALAMSAGGITINLLFDAAAMAAPASFRAGIQQAASILTAAISDKITVNIKIDYSGVGGGAAAGPDNGTYQSYSSVRADLINNASPGDTTFNALPNASSLQGQSSVAVWNAQLKLWGILGANDTTTDDGSATFATDINPNLLVGVALHELTHAMGRVPYGPPYGPQPDIFDLFRFTSPGVRLINGGNTAPSAYFSIDGGNTKLADFGQISDPSDFLNSGVQGPNDPFNEFYTSSTSQVLTAADKEQLDALGFHTAAQGIVVTATASQALQGGPAVALLSRPPVITDSASATLSSATIKVTNAGGSAVAGDKLYINGQQSGTVGGGLVAVSWNDTTKTLNLVGNASVAAYQTLLSQITYQDGGTDSSSGSHPLRTVSWAVNDGTYNLTTASQIAIDRAPVAAAANVILNASRTTVAASSLLTASDPDADAIAIYAFKDTGNGHFVLNGVAQANNQEIDVTAAQLSQLTYQTAGGTDSLQVRVNDGALWSPWQSFTVTGPSATVTEALGSTTLVKIGNNFYLDSISSGIGPELKSGGVAIDANQTGSWTPIGAEQTATGYEVAWKLGSQYTVWATDSGGNFSSSLLGVVSGSSTALQSLETSFHQDLNGDGTIGLRSTVIEALGSTSLVEVGSNFYLDGISSGTGPELKSGGAAIDASQAGGWAPIGVEQTATGYEVAWKLPGTDQYTVWATDSGGNYSSSLLGVVSGSSVALESVETSFHQDLNGDGVIGIPSSQTTVIESVGSTSLAKVGSNFYLFSTGSTIGPELKSGGAAIDASQTGGWAPIGAEQTATGYEVAWKLPGTDQYTVWATDGSGNYSSSLLGVVSGSSTALQSIETGFHQDLNGDGLIGPPPSTTTVIETSGSTSLVEVGTNFYLDSISSGTGPQLKSGGGAIDANHTGGWAAIGAEQTATGYEVAWKLPGTDQYTVWATDGSGNYTSSLLGVVSGSSTALQSLETSFHQDLNGDGTVGLRSTVIEALGSTSLVEVGSNFYLDGISSGTGPELKSGGAAIDASQTGGWAPIGVEQTATGYEVAWKFPGADQYTVWATDSSGNYTSSLLGVVSGSSTALKTLETSFHQDLNGDGTIGLTTPVAPSGTSSAPLLQAATNDVFVFRPGLGTSTVTDAAGSFAIELAGFSSVTDNAHLAAFVFEAQNGRAQTLFQPANDGHDTIINLGNHDSLTLVNFHISDLHAHDFIIR